MINIRITLPTKWNDLSPFQLQLIGRLLYSKRQFEGDLFRSILVAILFVPKLRPVYFFKMFMVLRRVTFKELHHYADFVFNHDDHLTRFPEFFKVKAGLFSRRKIYGPAMRLSNITINELSYADAFYFNWMIEGKNDDLRRLVACLYRQSGEGSSKKDRRDSFDKLLLPDNAKLTDKIPLHEMYIVALAYQGSRELIKKRYPYVFPKKSSTAKPEAKPSKPRYTPFSKIVQSMAMDEVQVFGNLQQTENVLATQFLEVYNETLIRQSKQPKFKKR